MLFLGERGEEIEFFGERSADEGLGLRLAELSDDEVRGFLAQLLTRIGIDRARAARVLRVESAELTNLLDPPIPEALFDGLMPRLEGAPTPGPIAPPRGRVRRTGRA